MVSTSIHSYVSRNFCPTKKWIIPSASSNTWRLLFLWTIWLPFLVSLSLVLDDGDYGLLVCCYRYNIPLHRSACICTIFSCMVKYIILLFRVSFILLSIHSSIFFVTQLQIGEYLQYWRQRSKHGQLEKSSWVIQWNC